MRLFLFVIFTVVLPFVASATTIPETIRIILPTDGSEYNLNGGSSFNTLTIDSTKFTFEIPAGGSVELISQDKKNLSNDGSYSVICNSNDSRLVMSVATGGATKTVIVTPSGTCSTSVSGGGNPSIGATFGGGGGGGGGGVSTPAGTTSPTPSPASASTSTVAVAPAPVTVSLPSTTSIPAPVPASINFEKDLAYGMENNDVSRLQALLADDKSIYPEGIVSGYFGPATQRAVKRFQAKYGLPQVGRVGPQTRAKLAEVFGGKSSITPSSAATPSPSPAPALSEVSGDVSALFTIDLVYGNKNDDIERLQELLAKDSIIYPEGIVSGYFGPATQRAVKRFQAKYGLPQVGRVGPQTRAKLAEVFGDSDTLAPVPSTTPSGQTSAEEATIKQLQDQLKALQDQLNALK